VKAYVDRAKMSQVIHNLVSNGLKFTPPGGHVSVIVTLENESMSQLGYADDPSPSNPWVKISVTDAGVGLSQVKFVFFYIVGLGLGYSLPCVSRVF